MNTWTKVGYGLLLSAIALSSCGSDNSEVLGKGSFEAREVLVSSEVNGKVLSWNVREGQTLEEGEVVGLIDTLQLYYQREALLRSAKGVRAARPDVETQVAALQVQLSDLRQQRERVARLLEAGVSTQKELEDIEVGISALESQIAATSNQLQKSGAQITAQSSSIDVQVAQLNDLMERSIIKSPITGTVIGTYVEAGELAGAGTPLFRIAYLDQMILSAYVRAEHLPNLQVGQMLQVRIDGVEGASKLYEGRLTWISPKAEFTPTAVQSEEERANLMYAIKVEVPNDGLLKIGMYGEVLRP